MSSICVPGLLALLAVAPLTVRADDKADTPARAADPAPADKPAAVAPAVKAVPLNLNLLHPLLRERAVQQLVAGAAKPEADKPVADKPADKPAESGAEKKAEAPAAAEKDKPAPAPDKALPEAKPAAPAAAVKRLPALKLAPAIRAQLGNAVRARAAAAAAADDSEESLLTDEDRKAIDEFAKKVAKEKKKLFEESIKTEVASVAKNAKLERDAEKKLSSLSAKAVEAALPEWEKAFAKWVESILPRSGGGAKSLATWSATSYARNTSVTGFSMPADTDAWKAALKEVLTPAQLAAHDEAVKAEEKKFQQDFGDYLATCEGQAGDQMAIAIDSELSRIAQFSGIDEDRQKKLKTAGDEAVKQCVKDWRVQMEKQLKAMEPKQREQMTARGGSIGVNLTEKNLQPKERAVWKDAVAALLKDDERQTLEKRYQEVRGRRADALAVLLANDLDRLVGFSAEERQKFLPLASKRLLKLPDYYFVNPENGGWYSLDMGQLLQHSQKMDDAELKPFLNAAQVKRFRSATPDQMSRTGYSYREKLDFGEVPKPEEMDEGEVERILSRFLHKESKKMKLKMFSTMEAQVDHVARVTKPSPETVGVLTTAAKGAAEEMAQNSIASLSNWLRTTFQSVKPSDMPSRLENLFTPYLDRNSQTPTPALWTSSVQRLLNEDQRKLWKTEIDAREVWRREGLTGIVLTELEKRLVLSADQRTRIGKKVDEVLKEYEPDFANYFSFGWHLQGYYTLIPIAMFTDKELEEYFDKKQVPILKDKSLPNATQYAESIRNQHNSRIRRQ